MKRMAFLATIVALLVLLNVATGFAESAEGRYALVIGNGNYGKLGKLANPVNDAHDMADALKTLRFSVILLEDANLQTMEKGVIKFGNELSGSADAVGFFFYAGHGVQSNGINYLIPTDADIAGEAFLRTKALAIQEVLDTIQQSGNQLNVIVLDACRDNPFSWSRSGSRGLTVVSQQPPGSIIAYATSAGSVAQDGSGRNGTFTGELMKNLKTPGINIFDVFIQTGADVKTATSGAQIPAIYNQYFDRFYLAGAPTTVAVTKEMTEGRRLEQYIQTIAKARDAEKTKAWGDALNAYALALTIMPDSETAAFGRARAYRFLGNKKKADELFRTILTMDSVPDQWALFDMADFYQWEMRNPDISIGLYTKCIAAGFALPAAYHHRGAAYRDKGEIDKARADFGQALKLGEAESIGDLVEQCKRDLAALGQ